MAYIDTKSPVTEEECIAVIDKALELGCTHLDTSNVRSLCMPLFAPARNMLMYAGMPQ